MALEVYFKDDIRHVLSGLLVSIIETAQANGMANIEHLAGILTLGKGLALSFGLSWPAILGDVRLALGDDLRGLLDRTALLEVSTGKTR